MPKVSLTWFQSIVGLAAGVISIAGGAYSAVQLFKPGPQMGEVVAVVRDAKADKPVPDATVEILTPQDALVSTLTSKDAGQARQLLPQGPYRVRVTHPKFGSEVRQVQVLAGQTAEIRVKLNPRGGGSSPFGDAARAVNEGVGAVERFFRGLGL